MSARMHRNRINPKRTLPGYGGIGSPPTRRASAPLDIFIPPLGTGNGGARRPSFSLPRRRGLPCWTKGSRSASGSGGSTPTSRRRNRSGERSANPERGREGWKEIARVAGIRNLQERTSTMKWLHSSRDSADVFPPNTHSGDRGEITSFPSLLLMIGAANGRKRRGEHGRQGAGAQRDVSLFGGRFAHHLVSYIAGYSDNRRTVERRRCCLFAGRLALTLSAIINQAVGDGILAANHRKTFLYLSLEGGPPGDSVP